MRHTAAYALSMLVTGAVSFASIPIIRHLISAENFSAYSILFNGMLITSLIVMGWLSQSLLRFGQSFVAVKGFGWMLFRLSILPLAGLLFFTCCLANWLHQSTLSMVLCMVVVLEVAITQVWLSLGQAMQWSKVRLIADSVKSIIFLLGLLILYLRAQVIALEILWLLWLLAYGGALAVILIFSATHKVAAPWQAFSIEAFNQLSKKYTQFGWPMSFWLLGIYLLSTSDRYFLTQSFSLAVLADYFALHEVIVKGMGFLLSPATISFYPAMTKYFDEGNRTASWLVMRKMLIWYAVLILVALLGYLLLYPILVNILGTSHPNHTLFVSGILLVFAAGLWHWNVLLHKPFELKGQTNHLMYAMLLSVLSCLLIQFLFTKNHFIVASSLAFLTGVTVYALYISAVLWWTFIAKGR